MLAGCRFYFFALYGPLNPDLRLYPFGKQRQERQERSQPHRYGRYVQQDYCLGLSAPTVAQP